jgi:PAS domain S-box-containing protein
MDTILKIFRGHRKTIIILSVIFTALIAAGVYSYYIYERSLKYEQSSINLKAISGLKNDDVTRWLSERKAEADFFSSDYTFIDNTTKLLSSSTGLLKNYFYKTLHTTKENHNYDDIFIASLTGDILFSFSPHYKKADEETAELIKAAANNNEITLRNFYYCRDHKRIHLDIISPITVDDKIIAAAVFRINPADKFYPLLLKWPVSSKTSESYIVRKEKDHVIYCSELRHAENAALTYKIPLTQKEHISVKAALGYKGLLEGYDYRDEKALAFITPVRGTDWFLISKTDNSEIYAEAWNKTILVTGLAITLVLFFVSGLTMAYELEEKKMKLNILAKERDLKETRNEYRTTLYSIGDAVITSDSTGKIQHMNSVAEKLTGWQEYEAAGQNLEEVFILLYEKDNTPVTNIFNSIINRGLSSSIFSGPVLLKSKTGKLIPIADSGAPIRDEDNKISGIVIVFRDQTKARETERILQENEQRYRALFNNHHTNMLLIEPETGNIVDANPAACNFYGYTLEQFTQLKVFDLNQLPPKEIAEKMRAIKYGSGQTFFFKHKLANGLIRDVEVYSSPVSIKNKEYLFSIIHDITSRKETERALKTSEEKFSKAFKTSPDSININRLFDGMYIEINEGFTNMTGYTWDDVAGKTSYDIGIWADEGARLKIVKAIATTGEITNFEARFRLKDGNIRTGLMSARKITVNNQECILSITRDITERKEAEEALRESEEHLRAVTENMSDGLIITNSKGEFLYWNKAALCMHGFPEDYDLEVLKASDIEIDVMSPEGITLPPDRWPLKRIIAGEHLENTDFRITLKATGEVRIFNYNGTSVFLAGGERLSFVFIKDITKQYLAEENIKKLSMGIEQNPAIIIITDKDGNIEYTNPKFTQVTGYTADEVKGKNPKLLKSGHITREEYQKLWETILAKKEWHGEFLNKKKNGELYWESAMISPLLDEKGNIINFIALKEDITELKRITDELIKAKEKAEEMNRLKSYFFANISHELRTPFVGIIGFSEILSERLQDPGEQKMAEAILTSSKRLTETLNKILDISKLEFDKMELYTGPVNLRELAENTANLYSKTAAKKQTSIITDTASAPGAWKTDERLLREILNNLVNNAVKFTTGGEVKISILTNNNLLVIKVADTGVGIPEEKQEIIWQEFRQASEGYNRSFEGTGLGLSITKKYTSLLGGKIHMTSKPGTGTEFTVELPELTEEAAEKKREENAEIRLRERTDRQKIRHRVLYVEDDFISIEFVKEILQNDFNLDIADRPQAALNLIKENFYDAILLDINLGGYGMNGIDLMLEIKKTEGYKNIPMVAVTAYASKSDEQEFLSKGFSHYLSKPFLSRGLTDLLEKIFSRQDS